MFNIESEEFERKIFENKFRKLQKRKLMPPSLMIRASAPHSCIFKVKLPPKATSISHFHHKSYAMLYSVARAYQLYHHINVESISKESPFTNN